MADFLSVDRSALSAELSKMKKEGLIDYHKDKSPCGRNIKEIGGPPAKSCPFWQLPYRYLVGQKGFQDGSLQTTSHEPLLKKALSSCDSAFFTRF